MTSDCPNLYFPFNPQVTPPNYRGPQDGEIPAPILTRAVDPLVPLVSQWKTIVPEIIKLLNDHSLPWVTIELFGRSQIPSINLIPTVLITVPQLDNDAWISFGEECLNLVRKFAGILSLYIPISYDF